MDFTIQRGTLPQSALSGCQLPQGGSWEWLHHSPGYSLKSNVAGDFHRPYESSGEVRFYRSCGADAKKPRLLARLFYLCWHYLSSRQVTLQVLSAQMSLTAVFGMGTGGPSSQSIPTMSDEVLPHPLLCQSPRSALTSSFLLASCEKLVTRTGFEPMLKA